jgi:hypothetical protein
MQREPHLAATAALVLIVLVSGVIATSLQWRRAGQRRARVRPCGSSAAMRRGNRRR